MVNMPRCALFLAFAALLLASLASADFEQRSLKVSIIVNPDGSAHVEESIRMFITGQQSIDLYENSFVYNDLSSWSNRTGLGDISNHVTRAITSVERLRIRPNTVDGCNTVAKTCYATLTWDYDVSDISQNQTGLVKRDYYKPRTTRFSINPSALAFPVSKNGDIILSKEAELKVTIPDDSQKVFFSKIPTNMVEAETPFTYDRNANQKFYTGPQRAFSWSGETLSQFELSFEREDSLESEILSFFSNLQKRIFAIIISWEGVALLVLAGIFALSVTALHSKSRLNQ